MVKLSFSMKTRMSIRVPIRGQADDADEASPSAPAIFLTVQSRVAGRFGRMFAQQLICLCSPASYLLRAFHIEIRPLAASYSVYLHVWPVHGCIGPGQPSKQSINSF